jgi:hypothetical protein
MTYQQYYNKLIKDLATKEDYILKQNKLLKGEKGYLDKKDMYVYMGLRNDLNSFSSKCDALLKLIRSGEINPDDEVEPLKFPDAG